MDKFVIIWSNFCDYLLAEESVRLTVSLLCVDHALLHHLQQEIKVS